MSATDWLEQLGFLVVALFTLGSALGVVLARRVLHAALWLLPTLVGVAGAFALLGAHLMFALQLVVYVGAITVLIIFAVILLEDEARQRLPRFLRYRIPLRYKPATDLVLYYYSGMQHVLGGLVAAGMMAVVLIAAIAEAGWYHQWKPLQPEDGTHFIGDNARLIGELFLTRYLLPFEVASVVLLATLVGAVVLARRDVPRGKAPEAGPTPCEPAPSDTEAGEAQ
jgi:NADH:ubiquinone oxidoreductase subunit 6 (subunit J)